MTKADENNLGSDFSDIAARELRKFRRVTSLHDYWARRPRRSAYYWYVTFENCAQLSSLIDRCRTVFNFPYYDFVAPDDLHATVDRIGYRDDTRSHELDEILSAAVIACRSFPPIRVTVGGIGGTAGAIGFAVNPIAPILNLRETLRHATLSAHPAAAIKDGDLHPHVTMAYCNSIVPAAQAISAAEVLAGEEPVSVLIREVSMVLLERQSRADVWHSLARIPLGGPATTAR